MTIKALYPASRPSLDLNFAATKRLDPRITFTRASTATYYDGQTQTKAEENLVSYSENFTNAWWIKNDATVSGDATTAPNGTLTADKLIATSGNIRHYLRYGSPVQFSNNIAGTATVSVFAKAGEYDFVYFLNDSNFSGGNQAAFFNLASGTVATVTGGNVSNAAIEPAVASGWYRCSVQMTDGGGMGRPMGIGVSNADGVLAFAGDNSSGIFLWGAQYEQRAALTAYVPTTTSAVINYMPQLLTAAINQPRFDHSPVTNQSLGFLVERSVTNLLLHSADFTNAAWVKTGSAVVANQAIAPDGTLSADFIREDTGDTLHQIFQTNSTAATNLSFTAFCKAAGRNFCYIYISGAAQRSTVYVNLLNGAITQEFYSGTTKISSSAINVGAGWWKISVNATVVSTASVNIGPSLTGAGASSGESYPGDGYSGIYAWGAQLEGSTYSTSYIPTEASAITKSADVASITGANFSSWFNPSAGTIRANSQTLGVQSSSAEGLWSINSSTANEASFYGLRPNYYRVIAKQGNSTGVGGWVNSTSFPRMSVGMSYDTTTALYNYNGTAAASFSNFGALLATQLQFGIEPQGRRGSAHISRFTYWPVFSSGATLQAITG